MAEILTRSAGRQYVLPNKERESEGNAMAVLVLSLVILAVLAGIIVWYSDSDSANNGDTVTNDFIVILFATIVIGMVLLIMTYNISPSVHCH
jgi:hypothetical protein